MARRYTAVVAFEMLWLVGAACGQETPGDPVPEWQDAETRLVLGRVSAATWVDGALEYRLSAIHEWRERVGAGQVITVIWSPWSVQQFIREFSNGDLVLFPVRPTAPRGTFRYTGDVMDIGVVGVKRVPEKEVPLVVGALKEMRRVHEGPRDLETIRRKARVLMGSSNYYVWCIGAAMWSRSIKGREDAAVFEQVYADERTSLRKIVWLEWLLMMQPKESPLGGAARHALLETYFRKRFAELPLLPEEREEEGRTGATTRPAIGDTER